jgi:hypothetical protein
MKPAAVTSSANPMDKILPGLQPTYLKTSASWLGTIFTAAALLLSQPARSGDFADWSFAKTEFDLVVFRVPFSLTLAGAEDKGGFRHVSLETAFSLSLVREKEGLASLKIEPQRDERRERGWIEWAGISAGYGQIATLETAAARGYNAAVWNPESAVYIKTTFTF